MQIKQYIFHPHDMQRVRNNIYFMSKNTII